jgi:hypothetical protein
VPHPDARLVAFSIVRLTDVSRMEAIVRRTRGFPRKAGADPVDTQR